MRKLFQALGGVLRQGGDAVLVSIVASSGSTPRGAGAHMLVSEDGRICGTIGGGAVEHYSERLAENVRKTRASRLVHFRLTKDEVLDLGMICGGNVDVYFHYISAGSPSMLALTNRVEELFVRGEESWLIAGVTPDTVCDLCVYSKEGGLFGAEVPAAVIEKLGSRSGLITVGTQDYYCETLVRAGKVYIFGGGHVAQALVPVLAAVGFRCIVLEDREKFCVPELFPGVEETRLIDNMRVLDYADIRKSDYIVIMTRGHQFDQEIQAQALRTPARYIGVIGSRKKTEKVQENLRASGFTDADFARITTPIGLSIGAETPEEIAVSIAAQLIAVRAGKLRQEQKTENGGMT